MTTIITIMTIAAVIVALRINRREAAAAAAPKAQSVQAQACMLAKQLAMAFGVPMPTVIFATLNGQGGKYNRAQTGKIYIDPSVAATHVHGGIMGAVAHEFAHYLQDVHNCTFPLQVSAADVAKYTAICEKRQDSRNGYETFAYWFQYEYRKFL